VMDAATLYMIVVCTGQLCMPIDSVGAYTLTLSQCRERVVEMERITHTAVLDCFSSEEFETKTMAEALAVRDQDRPIMIAPSHH
jgi:hypothetical protein